MTTTAPGRTRSGRPAPYEVRVVRGVRVDTAEPGTTLGADVFLPVGAGPVPAVVSVLPYRRDVLGGAGCWDALHRFAAAGYASVLVDSRGLGSSDGTVRPPFDPAEAEDGVAAVEWAARQSWCSGPVGIWGFSYGALLALRTAARAPAPLRAVVSLMGLLDPERDFVHPGGARGAVGPLGVWGLGTLVNQLMPPLWDAVGEAEQQRWRERVEHAEPYLLDACGHPPGADVWRGRILDTGSVRAPTLSVGGWRDMFCDAAVRIYDLVRGPRQLLVGPWMHSAPDDAPDEPVDATALALRWWDRWLGPGDPAGPDAPVTIYVQGADPGWRKLPAWPPASTPTGFRGSSGGRLAAVGPALRGGYGGRPAPAADPAEVVGPAFRGGGRPAPAAEVVGTARPDPTLGTLSGLWGIPNGGFGGPLDQRDDDLRAVSVTGRPLAEPLLVVGRPTVTLDGPAPGDRVVVKLTDIDPTGRSTLVTGGILAPVTGVLRLDPTAYRFAAGHRLRLVVGAGAFPRVWPDPAAGDVRVTRLELALPVVFGGIGEPVDPPRPSPPLAGSRFTDTPRWEIVRDPLRDQVTVTVCDDLRVELPGGRAVLRQNTDIRATVARADPAGAELRATCAADVRLESGRRLAVRVELRLTCAEATAHGTVDVDSVTVVRRSWQVAVPPEAGRGEQGGERE